MNEFEKAKHIRRDRSSTELRVMAERENTDLGIYNAFQLALVLRTEILHGFIY